MKAGCILVSTLVSLQVLMCHTSEETDKPSAFDFLIHTLRKSPDHNSDLSQKYNSDSNEYTPNVSELLSRRIHKRSPDYYDDYDDYDFIEYEEPEPEPEPPAPPSTPKPSTVPPFEAFDVFILKLSKLQEALNNPDYDWSQKSSSTEKSLLPDSSGQNTTDPTDLQDLLVLVGVLKQLSLAHIPKTTTPSPHEVLIEAQVMLDKIFNAFADETDPEKRREILATAAPKGQEPSVSDAVDQVVKMFQDTFGDPTVSLPPVDMASFDGPALILNMTLVLLEQAEENYNTQMREREDEAESGPDHYERLQKVIQELHTLSEGLIRHTTIKQITTSAPPIRTTKIPNQPCTSPFVEIAYKMCILPVLDRQLSWDAAQEYCRSMGSTLAMDPVVVKGRRYLNDLLGESGTRERWTIWIGGKKNADNEWYWTNGLKVPGFLWNKGQPRTYSSYSVPSGTCMALDGFAEYYGTSLPCHNRRRFLCQRHY